MITLGRKVHAVCVARDGLRDEVLVLQRRDFQELREERIRRDDSALWAHHDEQRARLA